MTQPRFFAKPEAFRAWLEAHHRHEPELLVCFYKRGTGKPSITRPESVDEALSFGWIDGVRRSVDELAYTIRFTPRRSKSIWSAVNVGRAAALAKEGRMRPAGLAAFEARTAARTAVYSFERKTEATLTKEEDALLRANKKAATYFDAQAPWYRRTALHWVVSAKREATRVTRLAHLIEASAAQRAIKQLDRKQLSSSKKNT